MIVPMKKAAVIVQAKDAGSVLKRLRGLGIIHVEHQQPPKGKDIAALGEDLILLNEARGVLSEKGLLKNAGGSPPRNPDGWQFSARHIIDLRKRLDHLEEYSRALVNQIGQWERWGDFDPEKIISLAQKDIHLRFYRISAKEMEKLPAGLIVKKISSSGGIINCVVISKGALQIPFKEVSPPKIGLESMKQRLAENKRVIEVIKKDAAKQSCYYNDLLKARDALVKELELAEALRGMGEAGRLTYLRGYVPQDRAKILSDEAKRQRWGIVINEPSPEDKVPTLIRNPRWISIITPLFKIIEVVPGYNELDISPLFLIFFSLFFGMIIGDAGYGLTYLLITYLVQRRFGTKVQDKRIFSLLYLLSSCAIVWGLLTGTCFGQAWLAKSGVRALTPVLNDPIFLQGMCFFIGTTHLTLAHLWRLAVQVPALTALAELGWIGILWAAFLLAKMLLLGSAFPGFGKYLIIGGISLVVLFSSPRKNIFATIGAGLGTIALSLMNSFGDIVSYVRLFAVGLAGVAISDAFNAMAAGAAGSGIIGMIMAVFILTAGHLLNFVLSPMSVLVHGVRLNVLEFSGHAGITWSGTPYKPLKE